MIKQTCNIRGKICVKKGRKRKEGRRCQTITYLSHESKVWDIHFTCYYNTSHLENELFQGVLYSLHVKEFSCWRIIIISSSWHTLSFKCCFWVLLRKTPTKRLMCVLLIGDKYWKGGTTNSENQTVRFKLLFIVSANVHVLPPDDPIHSFIHYIRTLYLFTQPCIDSHEVVSFRMDRTWCRKQVSLMVEAQTTKNELEAEVKKLNLQFCSFLHIKRSRFPLHLSLFITLVPTTWLKQPLGSYSKGSFDSSNTHRINCYNWPGLKLKPTIIPVTGKSLTAGTISNVEKPPWSVFCLPRHRKMYWPSFLIIIVRLWPQINIQAWFRALKHTWCPLSRPLRLGSEKKDSSFSKALFVGRE